MSSVCSTKSQEYTPTTWIQSGIRPCDNSYVQVQGNNPVCMFLCNINVGLLNYKMIGIISQPKMAMQTWIYRVSFQVCSSTSLFPVKWPTEPHASQKLWCTERTAVWKALLNLLNRCSLNFHWSSTCLVISSWEKEQYHSSNLTAFFPPILYKNI